MKVNVILSQAAALAALIAGIEARHGHDHQARHHHHRDVQPEVKLEKKGAHCKFPSDAGLIAVTPSLLNGGWAMSPDQTCQPGGYCPYACPPGQVSVQWDPEATSYSYPMSMNGGVYCDENGEIQKPFPNRPFCEDGTGAVAALNKASKHVSFCQTVLPGNEAMLIPTLVRELATLAVPDTNYWCETAAHFYINPPGIDAETACVWGTSSNPYGNWSPYVAGANTDKDGNTFVKLGWNPIYLEPATPFRNEMPEFGVEIECEGDSCSGFPCKIDPSVNGVNEMVGDTTEGAGGAAYCVVTVPKGEKANIVVFEKTNGGTESATVAVPTSSVASSTQSPSTTSTSASSTTSATSSTVTPSSTSTSTSTSSTAPPTPSTVSSSMQTPSITPSSSFKPSSSDMASGKWKSGFATASYTYQPHVFIETGSAGDSAAMATSSPSVSMTTSPKDGSASTAAVSSLTLLLSASVAIAMLSL